jgi:extradiol dioxygenase family protein
MSDIKTMPAFHLAIPVDDLGKAESFYGGILACQKGRSSEQWIDWNFFGHQLVTHLVADMPSRAKPNSVDDKNVPVPHFGVILDMPAWQSLSKRLIKEKQEFVIEPYIRFKGKAGEQGTFFLLDPAGNALEFKGFADQSQIFAT